MDKDSYEQRPVDFHVLQCAMAAIFFKLKQCCHEWKNNSRCRRKQNVLAIECMAFCLCFVLHIIKQPPLCTCKENGLRNNLVW